MFVSVSAVTICTSSLKQFVQLFQIIQLLAQILKSSLKKTSGFEDFTIYRLRNQQLER